jgi:hypothetical protein
MHLVPIKSDFQDQACHIYDLSPPRKDGDKLYNLYIIRSDLNKCKCTGKTVGEEPAICFQVVLFVKIWHLLNILLKCQNSEDTYFVQKGTNGGIIEDNTVLFCVRKIPDEIYNVQNNRSRWIWCVGCCGQGKNPENDALLSKKQRNGSTNYSVNQSKSKEISSEHEHENIRKTIVSLINFILAISESTLSKEGLTKHVRNLLNGTPGNHKIITSDSYLHMMLQKKAVLLLNN